MKIFLVLLAMVIGSHSFAQNSFDITKDKENGATVYRGQITFEDLHNQLSFTWLDKGVQEYKPDSNNVKFLQKTLAAYHLTVFMGTWCDDSQNLVPKLYRILQLAHYPMNQYMMYGVDRKKNSLAGEEKMYNITKVPTVILYKSNREVGRITESVHKSVEDDIQAIIEKDLQQQKH